MNEQAYKAWDDIVSRYREQRIKEEIERQMDVTSAEFPHFYMEAIHNADTIPGREDLAVELIKLYAYVDSGSHFDATTDVLEAYADHQATTIVDREIESKSEWQMKAYIDKRDHEIYRDDVQIVRIG